MFHRRLWRPDRHATSLGLAIGLAVAMLPPAPIQTVAATGLAILCRANIPMAAAAVWVSNPATWSPILIFQRELGRKLLPPADGQLDVGLGLGLESLRSVTVGVLITGAALGMLGYITLYLIWGLFPRRRTVTRGPGKGED